MVENPRRNYGLASRELKRQLLVRIGLFSRLSEVSLQEYAIVFGSLEGCPSG